MAIVMKIAEAKLVIVGFRIQEDDILKKDALKDYDYCCILIFSNSTHFSALEGNR